MRSTPTLPVRILTHNIRYATNSPFKGEVPWAERRQNLLNELTYHSRHCDETFICLQEVLHSQLEYIRAGLNTAKASLSQEWAYIGVGRDDGHQAGEYSPIFFKPSVWNLQHWETVWLSKTPSEPSKSWDAASVRIVTIGLFTHRETGNTVLALNTHLDDQGSHSRLQAARIIISKIRDYQQGSFGSLISGTFLSGDLNSQERQEAYLELTCKGGLGDTYKMASDACRYGNHNTFTGFGYGKEPPKRIDFILLAPEGNQPWRVDGYSVISNRFDDGVYNSDHCAVVADLTLVDVFEDVFNLNLIRGNIGSLSLPSEMREGIPAVDGKILQYRTLEAPYEACPLQFVKQVKSKKCPREAQYNLWSTMEALDSPNSKYWFYLSVIRPGAMEPAG